MIKLMIILLVLCTGILLIVQKGEWTDCSCNNPILYGCSCRSWVEYCFEQYENSSHIIECISGDLK